MRKSASSIAGRVVPWLLALGIIAPFCFSLEAETDLGWHLAVGRVVGQSGIPFRNTLAWTAPNEPWYATSWLFDWIAAGLVTHVGIIGLQVLMFVLIGLTLTGALLAGLRLAPRYGAWVAPLLSLLLIPRMSARPFVASWAILAWTLWLCLRPLDEPAEAASWDASFRRRRWAVPLIALGSNFHAGAIFPAVLLAIFCAEAFLLGGRRLRELGLAAAGLGALVLNPGGLFNVRYILEHLSVQQTIRIAELETPTFRAAHSFYILSAVVVLLSAFYWRTRPAFVVTAVAFAAAGFFALRLMSEDEVVATPLLALAVAPLARVGGGRVVSVAIGAVLVLLVADRKDWVDFINIGARWDETRLPVRAAEFVRAHHLDGRMYNGFEEGGYLEWAVPELQWFQDARIQAYAPEFFKAGEAVDHSPGQFREWLNGLGVEWAVATGLKRHLSGRNMFDAPDWALVYWDEASLIYVRRDVARFAPLIRDFEYRHFLPSVQLLPKVASATRAELDGWKAELDRFDTTSPQFPPAWLTRCAVVARRGEPTEACNVAALLEPTPGWRQTVEAARAMPVAP